MRSRIRRDRMMLRTALRLAKAGRKLAAAAPGALGQPRGEGSQSVADRAAVCDGRGPAAGQNPAMARRASAKPRMRVSATSSGRLSRAHRARRLAQFRPDPRARSAHRAAPDRARLLTDPQPQPLQLPTWASARLSLEPSDSRVGPSAAIASRAASSAASSPCLSSASISSSAYPWPTSRTGRAPARRASRARPPEVSDVALR